MYVGGVIDRTHQPLILMLMVLTPEDVSKVTNKEEYSTTTFIHTITSILHSSIPKSKIYTYIHTCIIYCIIVMAIA